MDINKSAAIVLLLKAGIGVPEIMRRFPTIRRHQIAYWRVAVDTPPFRRGRPRGIVNKSLQMKIRTMKVSGMSYSQIGKHCGLSHQRVQQYLRVRLDSKVCSRCGSDSNLIHAHHTDYATDRVVPVCIRCHPKIHKESSCMFSGSCVICRHDDDSDHQD